MMLEVLKIFVCIRNWVFFSGCGHNDELEKVPDSSDYLCFQQKGLLKLNQYVLRREIMNVI